MFYTALYHALLHPNLVSDVNGEYPLMERSGGERYTVFSLWDTCRNLHQLLTLVYPDRQREMLRSMTGMYEEWGWLPKWELYGRETFTMEGDPAIPVIVDSWMKGLRDFDVAKAYEAMRKSATTPGAQNRMRPDLDPYIEKGYIPLGRTLRATPPSRTRWSTTWPTLRCRCLPTRSDTGTTRVCSAPAHWATNAITARKAGLCVRSIPTELF